MYVSTQDVYDAAGVTSDVVAEAVVVGAIRSAQVEVDRFTRTTYWKVEDSGTASAGAASTLTDSTKSWVINVFEGLSLWIYSGTGSGQMREILSNTATAITLVAAWTTTPDNTSKYRVVGCATNPQQAIAIDGNDERTLFLDNYPIQILQSLEIDSTAVTASAVAIYKNTGKLTLTTTAEKQSFVSYPPQGVEMTYWYGVYPIPYEVERYVACVAAMKVLTAQVGGTFDDPSTIALPEGSVTVGQAYINIKSAIDLLRSEAEELKQRLVIYAAVC